jgi:hypothetical protein
MFTAGYSLISDHRLEFAKNNRIVISVWERDSLLEVGPIESFCDFTVIIHGRAFLRTICDFKVQEIIF